MYRENVNIKNNSIICLYGCQKGNDCGYCHNGNTSSYGFESSRIISKDYDMLMNRGFRRSGSYFYKPVMYEVLLINILYYSLLYFFDFNCNELFYYF